MRTRVDRDLLVFSHSIMEHDELQREDLNKLLRAYKKKFAVDVVYISEAFINGNGAQLKYLIYDDPYYNFLLEPVIFTKQQNEDNLSAYGNTFMTEEPLINFPEDSHLRCLRYGLIHNGLLDGGVGIITEDASRVFTEEEKEALKKLSRVVAGYIHASRIEQVNFQKEKQLERALKAATKANEAKSNFLLNMSHDIRTPLNAIMGFSKIAIENKNDPVTVEDSLNKIHTSGQHLLRLINDILDMSQIEKGRVIIDEEPLNIRELVKDFETMFKDETSIKNINFTVEFKNINNELIYGDRLKLTQIAVNIISNAIKYTKPFGSVTITLKQVACSKKKYASYELIVSDTGIGMSKEFQKRMFEPFERERTSTVSGKQGTGLGMAITKRLISLLHGTIQVTSEIGVGTTVVIRHTFLKCNEQESGVKSEHKLRNYKGKRVLIVEDNELNIELADIIMQGVGFSTARATDGAIALKILNKDSDFDLILMDIQMPYMNGFEATSNIRNSHNEKIANIPIIAMTANAFDEDRIHGLSIGMNDFITKPIDVEQLYDAIDKVI